MSKPVSNGAGNGQTWYQPPTVAVGAGISSTKISGMRASVEEESPHSNKVGEVLSGYTGKDTYQAGDLAKATGAKLGAGVSAVAGKVTGKESYRIGDFAKVTGSLVGKGITAGVKKYTSKDTYKVGDLTKATARKATKIHMMPKHAAETIQVAWRYSKNGVRQIRAGARHLSVGNDWHVDPRPSAEAIDAATPPARWWTPWRGWKPIPNGTLKARGADPNRAAPPSVVPPAHEAAALYPEANEAIGEVFVEVLEAEDLPGDKMSAADAYCLVVCESHCAVTNIVWNRSDPAWGAHTSYRAFRFPICHAYSSICLSVVDSDTHFTAGISRKFKSDDLIGRVAIHVGELYANTVYDCWFPLDVEANGRLLPVYTTSKQNAARKPALRMRFSVVFDSDTTRVLSYLKPASAQPAHTLAIGGQKSNTFLEGAHHALFASHDPNQYDFDVFKAQCEEIKGILPVMLTAFAAFEEVLFWRPGAIHYSVGLCVGFQFLLSYPLFTPAAFCFVLLNALNWTYRKERDNHRHTIHQRPSFPQIFAAAVVDLLPLSVASKNKVVKLMGRLPLVGRAFARREAAAPSPPSPLVPSPLVPSTSSDGANGGADNDSAGEQKPRTCLLAHEPGQMEKNMALMAAKVQLYMSRHGDKMLNEEGAFLLDDAEHSKFVMEQRKRTRRGSTHQEQKQKQSGVDGDNGTNPGEDSAAETTERDVQRKQCVERIDKHLAAWIIEEDNKHSIKKGKALLHAVSQEKLMGDMAEPVCGPMQEMQWTMMITPMRAVLHLFSWHDPYSTSWCYFILCVATLVLALLPWNTVVYYGMRVFGAVVFGPQMHFAGRYLLAQQAEAHEAEAEWASVGASEQARRLAWYRRSLVADELDAMVANMSKKSQYDRQRLLDRTYFLHDCKRVLSISERRMCRIINSSPADAKRSSSRPKDDVPHARSRSEWGRLAPEAQALEEEEVEEEEARAGEGYMQRMRSNLHSAKETVKGKWRGTGTKEEQEEAAAVALQRAARDKLGSANAGASAEPEPAANKSKSSPSRAIIPDGLPQSRAVPAEYDSGAGAVPKATREKEAAARQAAAAFTAVAPAAEAKDAAAKKATKTVSFPRAAGTKAGGWGTMRSTLAVASAVQRAPRSAGGVAVASIKERTARKEADQAEAELAALRRRAGKSPLRERTAAT